MRIKKIIAVLVAAIISVSVITISASADWVKTKNGTYYTDESGEYVKGWQTIDGSKYYFSKNGKMKTGWLKMSSGKKYFLTSNGKLATGLKKINGDYYYFNKNGVLQTGNIKTKSKIYRADNNGIITEQYNIVDTSKLEKSLAKYSDVFEIKDLMIYTEQEPGRAGYYKFYYTGTVVINSKKTIKHISVWFNIKDKDGFVCDDASLFLLKDMSYGDEYDISEFAYSKEGLPAFVVIDDYRVHYKK